MRLSAVSVLALVCAACAVQPGPPDPSPTAAAELVVDPARIDRARDALPEGYEVAPYTGSPAPIVLWGFAGAAESQPPQCRELGAPPVDPSSAQGWSASGDGGIVYAVVAASTAPPPGRRLLADCRHWAVTSGNTTGTVTAMPAPTVDRADTVAMTTEATTVVEGGTQTRTQAETFIAFVGDYVCLVTLVTDPGSSYPGLDAAFASDLLVETVSTLRG